MKIEWDRGIDYGVVDRSVFMIVATKIFSAPGRSENHTGKPFLKAVRGIGQNPPPVETAFKKDWSSLAPGAKWFFV